MGTWNYRIFSEPDENGEIFLTVREVYCGDDGKLEGFAMTPAGPCGNTIEELRESHAKIEKAFGEPILTAADFGQNGEEVMSYSFTVKAATKEEAKTKVAAELDAIAGAQPTHKVDRDGVAAVAGVFIDLLADPQENHEIQVMINGSLSWSSENVYNGAEVTVRAYVRNKI